MKKKSSWYIYRHKRRTIFAIALILFVLIYLFQDASFILRAITTIAFFSSFYFIDHFFDIRFKKRHYLFIILIGIASLLLSPMYFLYPQYDKVQHFVQPILICSIIFFLISKLNLEFKWKLVFTIFIVIAILGLFEISEYVLDRLFDLRLQGVFIRDLKGIEKLNIIQEPLDDTMIDIVFGVLGTIAYGLGTYHHLKINSPNK